LAGQKTSVAGFYASERKGLHLLTDLVIATNSHY
jgi:hypothetical protein